MIRQIIPLRQRPDLKQPLAAWFHQKWGIPEQAYQESMTECLTENSQPVPQWYAVMENNTIIAGAGVIEDDFHDRKDLRPNVCAVYVEKDFRNQGIAGKMLDFICKDMKAMGIDTLYLLTDHTAFYERYGWNFLCMVQGDGEEELSRMYFHKQD